MAAEPGQAAEDSGVVAEMAIAVQLAELAADQLDVVAEQGPLRVAGYLNGLPGAEVVVGLAQQRRVVGAKLAKLARIIDLLFGLEGFQFLDLKFELGERPLEIESTVRMAAFPFPLLAGNCRLPTAGVITDCVMFWSSRAEKRRPPLVRQADEPSSLSVLCVPADRVA